MQGNVSAAIDITALIAEAIRAKQAEEAKKYEEIEQTPEGKALTWHVTPEQIARINAGDRAALDEFFFEAENARRIRCYAKSYMFHNPWLKAIVHYQDLTQQLYCDLRTGLLKFRPWDLPISKAIYRSFRYAAVGGIDEVYVFQYAGERA